MENDFNIDTLDAFTRAYMECALWSSSYTSPEGECNFDVTHGISDIVPETRAKMIADCMVFQAENERLLADAFYRNADKFRDSLAFFNAHMGHDFWLTRNGHGAGFWDRGLQQAGDALTEACKAYPAVDLYLGDDGKIYA